MRRVRRQPSSRPAARGWWLALLAVASLLLAPTLASPAHAGAAVHADGCGMRAPASTPHKPAQPGTAAVAPERLAAEVSYPRLELRLAGVEPERGTPPPR